MSPNSNPKYPQTPPIILPYKGVWPTIHETAFIAPGAVVIGDVVIGAESTIWFNVTVRGDVHEIRIGARTNIQDGSTVHVTRGKFGTYIGDDVLIGHNVMLHACTLESGSFIGMSATLMDGAVVEAGAMVAGGALVTPGKRVLSGELWGGSPAKFMRKMNDEDAATIPRLTEHYAEEGEVYRNMLRELERSGGDGD